MAITTKCAKHLLDGVQFLRLGYSPLQAKILTIFHLAGNGGFVSDESIIEFVYGGCADGGPDDPRNSIKVMIGYLNQGVKWARWGTRRIGEPLVRAERIRGVGWRVYFDGQRWPHGVRKFGHPVRRPDTHPVDGAPAN